MFEVGRAPSQTFRGVTSPNRQRTLIYLKEIIVGEFSILAVSHIFIASASVKIADTYWNALYCDNCIYEEPESYNHRHCSACYYVIYQSSFAAKKSGEYKLGTGRLWFSNGAI